MARRKVHLGVVARGGRPCPQEARWNQIEFTGSPFSRAMRAAWRLADREERARINGAFPELLGGFARNSPGARFEIPA